MRSNLDTKPLSKLAYIQTGPFGSQLHKEDYVQVGTPIVTVEHLGSRKFSEQNLPCVSDSDKERLNKYVLHEGDIVFSRVGSVDRCSYVSRDYSGWMFSGRCLRIKPLDEIDPEYLYYFFTLESTKQFIRGIATGATMPSINTKFMGEVPVSYPSLSTQRKIAGILRAIDDKIELNDDINNNLEQQAKALFKSWFVDFEPFGGDQPSEMRFVPLQELCKVVTKGTTPTTLGKPFISSGINFLKVESILDNHSIDSSKFAYIDEETNTILKRSIIEANDIVFTIAGTLGRFALVDDSILPANTNQAVAIIRPDISKVSPSYLYSFFIGNWHNDYYAKRVQQAVQANLSLTTIKSLPIIVANKDTMCKYDELVRPLFALMKSNEAENRRLSNPRDTLLPKLMSGELDVTEIDR